MENHGQKRSAAEQQDILDGVKVVVVDIEGTTTPISFVQDKLFPYVRENIKAYVKKHYDNEEFKADLSSLREQANQDKADSKEGVVEVPESEDKDEVCSAVAANVLWQMDGDRKTTALKQLQGHMWREAYKTGAVLGEVFEDVVPCIQDWLAQDMRVFVYSSGSVEAQKLLFQYSDKGDLLELFSGFFDTNIGAKIDKESYKKIAEETKVNAGDCLFLTDLPKEAAAASDAGMKTSLVVREGNGPLSEDDLQRFNIVATFDELACDLDEEDFPSAKEARTENGDEDDDDDDEEDEADEGEEKSGDDDAA